MQAGSVAKSCLTLCDRMDCSPPGSSVPGNPGKDTGVGVTLHAPLPSLSLHPITPPTCLYPEPPSCSAQGRVQQGRAAGRGPCAPFPGDHSCAKFPMGSLLQGRGDYPRCRGRRRSLKAASPRPLGPCSQPDKRASVSSPLGYSEGKGLQATPAWRGCEGETPG